MALTSNTNPHIRDKNSPLATLAMQALRRYGDFHHGTVDGDVMMMFIEFANAVIDEIRNHPYNTDTDLDYYDSPTDVRLVSDRVMINGLLMQYAMQQLSDKASLYSPMFYKSLNQDLWFKLNGSTKIQLRVTDDGTNKRNISGTTSTINGLVT